MNDKLFRDIEDKYEDLGENPETYLKGLLHAKPINYWDYVEVETLLSLQKPRTNFKDEVIFIMYHQVTELVLKMITHELEQLVSEEFEEAIWLDKLNRIIRYTDMLITSFDVMKAGMNYDDYNTFRNTLAPASGFQSAQFRYIEIFCTRLKNLLNEEGKNRINKGATTHDYFEHIYWKDAGMDRKTEKKSLTLRQFEEKYLNQFVVLTEQVKGKTLEEKILKMDCSIELKDKLKAFDYFYNVKWPMVHLETAQHYLDKKGENKAATGGSEWKKYLHPKFQQRKFFPTLWTENDLKNWGESISTK
ncbi:MAG: tryptophan 2,3-dioxygenase [Flavobacteriales bacterium]|nr:tryptophan 2,3-dioxygenase [Flavobacteriales bacterium]